MKILVITTALDLAKPFTATPFLTQLFKGFYDEGHELFIIPYAGRSIQSFWWKSYPNPNYYKSEIMGKIMKKNKFSDKKRKLPFIPELAQLVAKPNLEKLIKKILVEEKHMDAILIINIPLNQIKGIARNIKKVQNIPILYYDLDIPTSLPSHPGFTFNHFKGADLSEYDSFVMLSEGSIQTVKELGAVDVRIVHVGIDPEIFSPVNINQDIDFFFMGTGGLDRKNNIKMMITEPSKKLSNKFLVSGRKLHADFGKAEIIPMLKFPDYRLYCNRSKINLNIVRELHAKTESTSTARPFELASMGCCIVSSPYKGLEKWFDIKKEILITNSSKESIEIYKFLLENPEIRKKMGESARNRVIKDHTAKHRINEFIKIIKEKN